MNAPSALPRLLLLLALLLPLGSCAVNPATGERQLSLVSEGQEIAMGEQADPAIVAEMGLYPDSSVQRYVRRIGLALAAESERPDLPWTFRVLDDPTVNAFALPGGYIYVTRGILSHLTSEAQLAGVLGHEIGHVTARHGANRMSRAQLAQLGLGLGMVFSEQFRRFGGLAEQSLGLLFLKFGRDDELQADRLGLRYMTRLAYDPDEMASVMRMLDQNTAMYSPGGRVPEWLSTHPDPGNRVARINEIVAGTPEYATAGLVERGPFLRTLENMPFGQNPRSGFVRDGTFHHPDLEFRFSVPTGWSVQNSPASVQMGPEDGGALLELRLSPDTPEAAAREFAAQEAVTASASQSLSIGGFPAVRTPFRAQTENGILAGEMTWIRFDNQTYALMGLSTESGWPTYSGTVRASVNSFDRETNGDILSIQPMRLAIRSLSDPTPWSVFTSRYPSDVEEQVVALVNQVDVGQALQSGLWKQIQRGR